MDEWFAATDMCISLLALHTPHSLCAINLEVWLSVNLTSITLSRDCSPSNCTAQHGAHPIKPDRCVLLSLRGFHLLGWKLKQERLALSRSSRLSSLAPTIHLNTWHFSKYL